MPTPRKTAAPKKAPAKKAASRIPAPSTPGPKVGVAAKRAQVRGEDGTHVDPYAPTVWGQQAEQGFLVDLELPSGQVILAQRPGPEGLMAAGLLDDLDMLATVLPKVLGGGSKAKEFDATQIMKNPKMMADAIRLMNRVICHVVIKPELTPEPDDPTQKIKGKIYPSSVGQDDKSFIFNWAVGGTRNLTQFRQQLEESVASVDTGDDMEMPPE